MARYTNPSIDLSLGSDKQTTLNLKTANEPDYSYPHERDVYFAFIDVLGFSDAYSRASQASSKRVIAGQYKDVFRQYFKLINLSEFARNTPLEMSTRNLWYAGQTSDSLYFYTDRIEFLMEYIKIYSYFSLYAMMQGVFLRGGIAYGTINYNEEYQFYGDSVINAYMFESVISKNPIVSVDERTYKDLKGRFKKECEIFICETKNRKYLEPFAHLSNKNSDRFSVRNFNVDDVTSDQIKKQLEKCMSTYEYQDAVYKKYTYLYSALNHLINPNKFQDKT